ncbi:MAG: low molecular weight phosphotyrosine protein phosphatase [Thermus sp.]|uniref:low molecular weight protein-tyrosine-phosphatase n=1 Tax=Thermus sp. TaxID=275 RepID=UPI0025F49F4C|nr:low molecular weight protein-tyrosine-phosphatase [Thermus sp.]MCS6867346.1 low molecular weight phosphotyrosine protein phosphatase [Thermus sp.]MCS7218090.1 low molecular weight phosphotyrosine protein phosphatase [Thermus sp.]MCX7849854.1 low molecular weight phosphotyrosine protein phosphatase [Thermus sp.]MDW8017948.1 low molecular weight protein-tyrosine-phosphatase [Thermus sp.]MDW8357702.1 low molecular weight protein-tyrosine-phosphatase [Thermus sp.]
MGGMEGPIRVLFVCLGNICRSPLAEGAFRKLLRERGLEGRFEVDSAGTGAWHAGEPMDPRARKVLEAQGAYFPHVARAMTREDALSFHHILVMDRENLKEVLARFPEAKGKVRLLLDYLGGGEVADPYYGDLQDCLEAYWTVEAACRAFLDRLEGDGTLGPAAAGGA